MKRSILATFVIGLVSALIVIGLQISGVMMRVEFAVSEYLSRHITVSVVVGQSWQCAIVILLAMAMAWVTIDIHRRMARWLIMAFVLVQLVSATWVCGLYGVFFQPLPPILVTLLAYAMAYLYSRTKSGQRKREAYALFGHRISSAKFHELVNSNTPLTLAGTSRDATVIVCDIANQDGLAESLPGANYAGVIDSFIKCAGELFLQEGAFLDAGDGEGVRAIFGLPIADPQHALHASAAALKLLQKIEQWKKEDDQFFGKIDARMGISSGLLIASSTTSRRDAGFMVTGESLELARRFCVANRVYGSRVLLGSKTFDLAGKAIIARPIDFLAGRETRERFEVYELNSLASESSPETMARRDSFWSGVIHFRGQRYQEAFAAFERARENGAHDDPALQWYLRKVQALRLHFPAKGENAWVGEPLPPL